MPDRAEQRDRETQRSAGRPMASPFSAKVVGVSFVDGYPQNLLDLHDIMQESTQITGDEPFPAILRRNPDNEYDSNAIEVHAPVLGTRGLLGHLTRPIAARLAPELDRNVRWAAEIEAVLIEPSALNQPGVSIRCRRLEEGEQVDADGFARSQVAPGGWGGGVFRVRRLTVDEGGVEGVSGSVAPTAAEREASRVSARRWREAVNQWIADVNEPSQRNVSTGGWITYDWATVSSNASS